RIALCRGERGRGMLGRIVALDVLVAALSGCLALVSLWFERSDLVLVLTVLALVGFVGSVTLARFAAVEPEDERRILTPREAAEADARERFEDEIRARLEQEHEARRHGPEHEARRHGPEDEARRHGPEEGRGR